MIVTFRSYYVHDKNGNIEMEISSRNNGGFTIHYPQYEQQREILHSCNCFMSVTSEQLGMILFAYDKDEYFKFCEFYKSKIVETMGC